MGRAKAEQKIGDHSRKVGKTPMGLTSHSAGGSRAKGYHAAKGGASASALRKPSELKRWPFLVAKRPWPREKLREYLLGWCADNGLLTGRQTDIAGFEKLCLSCELIVDFMALLEKARPTEAERKAMLGNELNKLWDSVYRAMTRMDIKGASASASDPAEEFMREFDE